MRVFSNMWTSVYCFVATLAFGHSFVIVPNQATSSHQINQPQQERVGLRPRQVTSVASTSHVLQTVEVSSSTVTTTTTKKTNIDFRNFWSHTQATFTACETPIRQPDFLSQFGSQYWDCGDWVVRRSDHWSGQHGVRNIVNCKWFLNVPHGPSEEVAAMCRYEDFTRHGRRKKSSRTQIVLSSKKASPQATVKI